MGFLFGKKKNASISSNEPRINALKYEQSTFGAVKSVVYGTNRICGNVLESIDFTSIAHTERASAGKGGRSQTSTSYTYKARVGIGLCYGEIQGIKKVMLDDGIYSLSDFGLNLFKGTNAQQAWGEMQTYHPERALKYRNLAYVAGYIDLTSNGGVPQFNFEVNGLFTANTDDISPVITEGFNFSVTTGYLGSCNGSLEYAPYYVSDKIVEVVYYDPNGTEKTISDFKNYTKNGSTYSFNLSGLNAVSARISLTYNSTVRLDANPKDIVYDILTNEIYGAGFPSEYIDDLTNFSDFCIANNVFISPVYDSQGEAQEYLTDIANIANAAFIWTQGKLKLIPMGDEEVSDNGKNWTPDLTPIYDLTVDDFIAAEEPVTCTRKQQSEVYNSIKVEFLNRANDYNVEIVEAQDLASIELYGPRPADTMTAHQICTAEVARRTAQLALDRGFIRNLYKFKLPMKFILLDSMDIVTLTYEPLGLDREPVRLLSIRESEGELEIEVEELVIGTATPAKIQHQHSNGLNLNYNQTVGNINPAIIFEPPFDLTQDNLAVWVGISSQNEYFGGAQIWISDDDTTYKLQGEIKTPCRQGLLTAKLTSTTLNPDAINALAVDMSISRSEIYSGTQADADNLNTLCYVDGELLAYQNAVLTDDYKYNLSYLNRGAYGSEIKVHNAGTQFARIDESSFLNIPFKKEDIGKTIYIKFCSFNAFGSGYQSLADVNPYYYVIQGTALKQSPSDIQGLTDYYTDGLNVLTWNAIEDPRSIVYEIRKGETWEQSQQLGRVAANKFTANGNGTYFIKAYSPDYNVYSENAAGIEISGARLVQNVIATFDEESLNWTGAKSNSVTVDKNNILTLKGTGLISSIPLISQIKSIFFYGELASYGTYESDNIVDIGESASCYINVDFNFLGINPFDFISQIDKITNIDSFLGHYGNDISNSRIQISIAGNDGLFTDWKDFVTGQYFGRKFKFRAILDSRSNKVVCKMTKFAINVDVPDLLDGGANITIPNTGLTISSNKNFHAVPNTQLTILNKQNGDYEVLTNETAQGFDILIMNNGTPVQRSINWTRQGY